ncbi:MAG: DUF5017 domain-containing protein [Crocinitomicaceae bacterium]|nr:DUF5017 domain-containing protein [Crocinitomicaceae bacterium]
MKRLFIIISILSLATACRKEPDSPPENLLNEANAVTIDSLRTWQQSVSPNGVSITDSLHVYGIITMDESDGNLYKNLYMQDHTAGIQIRLTATSDYAVGDSVRINLTGAYLSEYAGVIQLDSIDPDLMIVKQSSGNGFAPANMDISDITVDHEGLLIVIDSVQFTTAELSNTYADHISQSAQNRILEDCQGNTILVRTSGFADYAGQTVKQGNGSIVAIVSRYNSELQLYIRSLPELTLDGPRCAGQIVSKDFEDGDINSGGWSVVMVSGTVPWIVDVFSGNNFAKITNWDGANNNACESWYISPELDLTASSSASISFDNDVNYSGDPLQLLVSTDYSGSGDPNLATWVDISSSVSWDPNGSSWGFHPSGSVDLSAYTGNTVYVGFKYTGTNFSGSTWEIDNILITG